MAIEGRTPPGPTGFFDVARRFNRLRANPLQYLASLTAEFGDFAHVRIGPVHSYFVNHPDHIHQVLVHQAKAFHKSSSSRRALGRVLGNGLLLSEGDFWKRQRRLAQPAFHHQRVQSYAQVMADYTLDMLDTWTDGQQCDIAEAMMTLTLKIVAKTLFDADVAGEVETVGRAMEVLQALAVQQTNALILLPQWVPTPNNRRQQRATAELDAIVTRIIGERRAAGADRGDLLSMLMLAEDDDGARMTDEQLRDEVMTLLLAGHETTANALTWTWYLLAAHPEAEAKLHAELDTALGGRPPALNDLPRLPYTELVLKESMRLYPPAWVITREAVEAVQLGDYAIPAGSRVVISPYFAHRSPRYFDAPEAFRPERFADDFEKRIPRYAYFPFGGGPRVCIGNQFAMMEAQLLLATIAQCYRMTLLPGQTIEPEPLITLRPKYGVQVQIHRRAFPLESVPGAATTPDPS